MDWNGSECVGMISFITNTTTTIIIIVRIIVVATAYLFKTGDLPDLVLAEPELLKVHQSRQLIRIHNTDLVGSKVDLDKLRQPLEASDRLEFVVRNVYRTQQQQQQQKQTRVSDK